MDPHEHFNKIAKDYDYWKSKNAYYYETLKKLLMSLIPTGSSVVEIGCGTGDILASLSPSVGLGVDTSEAMVTLAWQKYASRPELKFQAGDLSTVVQPFSHDYSVLVDVLEHISVLPDFLGHLNRLTKPGAKIIITLANPLWEPILMLTEKLGMKMPEGPHWRLGIKENERLFRDQGWHIQERGYRLLIPKKLPGVDWINQRFYKSKLLSRLGFVVFWQLKKVV